jgi:hypothetical protein
MPPRSLPGLNFVWARFMPDILYVNESVRDSKKKWQVKSKGVGIRWKTSGYRRFLPIIARNMRRYLCFIPV